MAGDTRQPPRPEGERNELPSWATLGSASPSAPPTTQPSPDPLQRPTTNVIAPPTPAPSAPATTKIREVVNEMPGGTANTAGGEQIKDYSALSVLTSIRPSEYQHFHRLPCVRDALLLGIPCGFGAGGLALVLGRATWTACNWTVLTFMGTSVGGFQYCQTNLQREKSGMKRAVEVMDAKRIEKDKRLEETREKRRRERREREEGEEKARLEEERRKKQWYKFW